MEPHDQQIKPIKTAIIGLFIALLFSVSAFALVVKKNNDNLYAKDLKISALISEVGSLRSDLEEKNHSYKNLSAIIDTMTDEINSLIQLANTEAQNNIKWQKISTNLGKQQVQMAALLTERENIINELALKNKNLKQEKSLPGISSDITSILILGQNQGLMDTIIIASANPKTKRISTFSIPRDLSYKGRKINELYMRYGIEELKKSVEEITGIKTQKYAIFDFKSFQELVDGVGGIEIEVPKGFTDNAYPGPDGSYKTVTFQKGAQTMNGDRALMYARSRKSDSDFARSKRQQQILNAVQKKIMEGDLLAKINTVMNLYAKVKDHINTDLGFFELLAYAEKFKEFQLIHGNVISTQNYLSSTKNEKGQYVLVPKNNSYSEIKSFVYDLIAT